MGLFRRRKQLLPGISNHTVARALQKDISWISEGLADELSRGETIENYFEAPPRDGRGQQYYVVTNQNLLWLDDEDQLWRFPLADLIGYRLRAGYIRLGFRGPTGVALPTAFIGGGPQESIAMYTEIVKAWSKALGLQISEAARLKDSPEVPPIETRATD